MKKRFSLPACLLAVTLAIGLTPSAHAATNFEVDAGTTLAELKAAVADTDTTSVTFSANKDFDGGLVISHPMTFTVNDDVTVSFDGTAPGDQTGLDIQSQFTLNNKGTINLRNFRGYGIKVNQQAGQEVTITGDGKTDSAINIGPTHGYGVDGQFIRGNFTVEHTALNIASGPNTAEGPIIFSKNGGADLNLLVKFDDVALDLNHSSKSSIWRPAFYSERPVEFNNTDLHSETVRDYNLSFVAGAPVTIRNSNLNLHTTADAVANSNGFFSNPFVSINTAGNTLNIIGSTVNSQIEAAGTHQAIQFQDATYNITGSTVVADSLGVDFKQAAGSQLNISGDSKVDIPKAAGLLGYQSMPSSITTVIDGGTVDLPDLSKGMTIKNSKGQALHEFISPANGASSDSVNVNCGGDVYNYPVSKASEDGNKHVWAPAVTVEYYEKESATAATETRTIIKGTSISEPLNAADFFTAPTPPAGFEGGFVVFDPEKYPEFTADYQACQDLKVTYQLKAKELTPIPDVDTEDVTVFVGDTVEPTAGLVNLPEGATVEVVTAADTSAAGDTTQTVKVTFKDGSSRTKVVKVKVVEHLTPLVPIPDVETKDLTVFVGDTVKATDGLVGLPEGATVEILKPADTSVAGDTTQTVKITFKDGSSRTKVVNVKVIERKKPKPPQPWVPWIPGLPGEPADPWVPGDAPAPSVPSQPAEDPVQVKPSEPVETTSEVVLARTGVNAGAMLAASSLLLTIGAGLVWQRKRRS